MGEFGERRDRGKGGTHYKSNPSPESHCARVPTRYKFVKMSASMDRPIDFTKDKPIRTAKEYKKENRGHAAPQFRPTDAVCHFGSRELD
jgi:hypothetical protein